MTEQPKSMRLFYIDNQGAWPKSAQLVGDLVVWPDQGRYPTYAPVAVASHPNFDGRIVVQAGNRGVLVTFCPGAKTEEQVREAFRGKPEQYRVAIDALVHRLVLHLAAGETHDEANALALLSWLGTGTKQRPYAVVLARALHRLMGDSAALRAIDEEVLAGGDENAFNLADAMLTTLQQAMATAIVRDNHGQGEQAR